MRRRLVIAAVLFLVLLVVAGYFGRAVEQRSRARFPSSFAAEPEGLLAFRRLLEELGDPVVVRNLPWDDLHAERAKGVLIVALPLQRGVDEREAHSLRSWLLRGGALLVIDDATMIERSDALDALLVEAGLPLHTPLPTIDRSRLAPERPRTLAARGTAARPAGSDLRRLMLHAEGGLRPEAGGIPLAISPSKEVVAAEGSLGAGRIVLVQGPLAANDRILEGDNLAFALRLVEDLRGDGGPISIDEYHHGYGGLLPALRGIDRGALGWAALQALVVTVLYGAARGIRFGPVRPLPEPSRRSSLEFVHSMASLYRQGGAVAHVLAGLLERFIREARARWGLPEGLKLDQLARIAAARAGLDEGRIREPLERVQDALSKKNLTDREMLSRAGDLDRLEREVFRGDR